MIETELQVGFWFVCSKVTAREKYEFVIPMTKPQTRISIILSAYN